MERRAREGQVPSPIGHGGVRWSVDALRAPLLRAEGPAKLATTDAMAGHARGPAPSRRRQPPPGRAHPSHVAAGCAIGHRPELTKDFAEGLSGATEGPIILKIRGLHKGRERLARVGKAGRDLKQPLRRPVLSESRGCRRRASLEAVGAGRLERAVPGPVERATRPLKRLAPTARHPDSNVRSRLRLLPG